MNGSPLGKEYTMLEADFHTLLQKNLLAEAVGGWCRNFYGDTKKIKQVFEEELSAKLDLVLRKKMILAEVTLDEAWSGMADVNCRKWIIWKQLIQKIQEVCPEAVKNTVLEERLENALNSDIQECYTHFLNNPIETVAANKKTVIKRDRLLKAYAAFGIQLVLIIYNFDEVEKIFPVSEKEGGSFFQDLFNLSPKANSSNKSRIVLVSQKEAGDYAHDMDAGSSFIAAYPEVHLE